MKLPLDRVILPSLVLAALALVSAASPVQNVRQMDLVTDTQKIRVAPIVQGLDSPWSMAFLPGGDILVTERPGRLRLIHDGKLDDEPIAGLPEIKFGRRARPGSAMIEEVSE